MEATSRGVRLRRGLHSMLRVMSERPLDELLARALPQLRVFVRKKLGQRLRRKESVSDVVQSACREVLNDLGSGSIGAEDLRRRLFKQADRKLLDRGRRHAAEKRDAQRERPLYDHAASTASPAEVAELHDELERVARALDGLAPADREVIVLASILDLPHSEVASHLGIAEGAARTRLCRALSRLAARL